MNAGSSDAGRRFAIKLSDMHFDAVETPEASTARIAETKRLARAQGARSRCGRPSASSVVPPRKKRTTTSSTSWTTPTGARSGTLAAMAEKADGRPRTDPQRSIHT